MEGGVAIFLILVILVVLGAAVFFFLGGRGATKRARQADADGEAGPRPTHEVPHPEQQEREKGTAFPSSS
jgi:hypothetical protein